MHLLDTDVASAPSISSPEFWKRPERVTASVDPDTATAQTIRIMCDHVKREGVGDPLVREIAMQAMQQFGPVSFGQGNEAIAESCWWWCKFNMKFLHHEFIIRRRLGEYGHLQGLITPHVIAEMFFDRQPLEGDCAIFTEMLRAMLGALGVPSETVTVAVNPREPSVYSHVFPYAVLEDGRRLPLDASHGDYAGWQVPSSDVFRRQVWDENGNAVADRGSRFDGLHNYRLRGLGVDPGADISEGGSYTPPGGTNPTEQFGNFDFTTPDWWSAGSGGSGGGGGFDFGSFFGNLANKWTDIGAKVIAPTTTFQRDARGNIMYSTPGSAPVPGTLTAGGGSSLLLIGGLALGAVLLFSVMGKK